MKVLRLLSLLCALLLTTTEYSFGQREEVDIKVYSFEDGLTHRNVFKIIQDPKGFIWIATINGLNKFDGHVFQHYSSNNPEYEILHDYVSDMVIDNEGLIWMANPNYLSLLNPKTNEVSRIKADSQSLVYNQPRTINSLNINENGKVILSAQLSETGASVFQTISDEGQLTDIIRSNGTYTKRAILESDGYYFVANDENQILKIDHQGSIAETYNFPELHNGLASIAWVNVLQRTANGTVWALLNNGQVFFLEKNAEAFVKHPISNTVFGRTVTSALLAEESGDIWVGGLSNLWHYEASSGKVLNYNQRIRDILKNNCTYRQIYKDASGVIWVASDFGAIKIARSEKIFTKYLDEGSEFCANGFCSMRGITEDDNGNIYFSYYNSIHVLDVSTNSLRPLFPENNFFNFPFGLTYHGGKLYTGNGKKIDLNTLEVDTLIHGQIVDLGYPLVDHENEIWLGFRDGIYIHNPKTNQTRRYYDPNNLIDTTKLDISYIYQSPRDQAIWLCTLGDGLYKLDKYKGVQGHYNAEEGSVPRLNHEKVNGVFEDGKGNLWLGTGNGLHKWDLETNKIKVYNTESGLANNFINGLLPEGDTAVWVSTDNGLARVNVMTSVISSFYKQNGLAANEFNRSSFYKSKNGRMFFGGLNGINAFFPSEELTFQKFRRQNKILFSGFTKLDGDSDSIINRRFGLSSEEPIKLGHRDHYFYFEFALANFKNPGANTYSYILEGYEEEWSKPTQGNIARYNGVPAGEYTFRVKAAIGLGQWNDEELQVKIIIEQAFYKTWWFMGVCFLAALAAIVAILEYRLYLSIQRERELQREVKTRTMELEHEKRKSDELLLNILPAETAEELKQFGSAKAKRYDGTTILFTDFKGFTQIAEQLSPEELVAEIDYCFKNFDAIIEQYGLEKIKTIGDAYMCAGGLPKMDLANPQKVINAALDIRNFMLQLEEKHKKENKLFFEVRLGVHTGDVVAGIVGTKKFVYDIWGDAVNIAARMESQSEEGKVNISGKTYALVQDHFEFEYRGKIQAKNKGEIDMYFVERRNNGQG